MTRQRPARPSAGAAPVARRVTAPIIHSALFVVVASEAALDLASRSALSRFRLRVW